jgi:hypothetical protein
MRDLVDEMKMQEARFRTGRGSAWSDAVCDRSRKERGVTSAKIRASEIAEASRKFREITCGK